MRAKLFFLILTLILSSVRFNVFAAPYGEDSLSLGQLVDDYENENNVSSADNVWNNVTLDSMELNFTGGVVEDFTSYTEVDEDGDLTITAPKIDISSMRRDAETYVWKDFNPDYFGNFIHLFKVNITDLEAGDSSSASITVFSLMTNSTPDVMDDLQASNWLGVLLAQNGANDDKFALRVWERDGGATVFLSPEQNIFDINDPIFITFNRTGDNVGLFIFDSEARNNLIQSWTGVGNGKTYRYLEPLANSGRNVDPADHYTGYVENMVIGGSGFGEGYFNTTDYFDYVNGSSLVWLTNSSIPSGTSLKVQFSNDGGSTYVDNEGNAGSNTLTEGHEALDLRDLNYTSLTVRYNFTGTPADTPRLYQSRLITTEDGAGGGPGPGVTVIESDAPWIALAIILSIIAFLLATRVKR